MSNQPTNVMNLLKTDCKRETAAAQIVLRQQPNHDESPQPDCGRATAGTHIVSMYIYIIYIIFIDVFFDRIVQHNLPYSPKVEKNQLAVAESDICIV